jgi:hypothetical protein
MTQPSHQDDLPLIPWTVRQFEHAWEIRAADGGFICFVQGKGLARAIAAIPEMRETIKTQHEAIFALNKELDRLRRLVECKDCMEYAQGVVTAERTENDRLRAENATQDKRILEWGDRYADLANDTDRLRAEKAELIEMLATRTTHPEYLEVLRRYKHANETEAEMSCTHDITDQDNWAEGHCPLCMQAELDRPHEELAKAERDKVYLFDESIRRGEELDRLRAELEQWRRLKPENERLREVNEEHKEEIERLRAENAAIETVTIERCAKLADAHDPFEGGTEMPVGDAIRTLAKTNDTGKLGDRAGFAAAVNHAGHRGARIRRRT